MLFQRSQTIFVVTLAMMEPLILVRSSTMEPSPVSQQDFFQGSGSPEEVESKQWTMECRTPLHLQR